jgi:hypothetical protein
MPKKPRFSRNGLPKMDWVPISNQNEVFVVAGQKELINPGSDSLYLSICLYLIGDYYSNEEAGNEAVHALQSAVTLPIMILDQTGHD